MVRRRAGPVRRVRAARAPYASTFIDGEGFSYDGSYGASDDIPLGWVLTARDCAGNQSTVRVPSKRQLLVVQEDGSHVESIDHAVGTLAYTGRWRTRTCSCASGGATRWTRVAGARFVHRQAYDRDDHVALVMAKGPRKGKAAVYVDGRRKATVNTHAAKRLNRVVVFDKWMPAGVHTVRVVNLATSGHPQIELDVVLTN